MTPRLCLRYSVTPAQIRELVLSEDNLIHSPQRD